MMEDRWERRTIKSLSIVVDDSCLALPFNLGIPGSGGTLEDCAGSRGVGAALMGPLLALAEVPSKSLLLARGANTH